MEHATGHVKPGAWTRILAPAFGMLLVLVTLLFRIFLVFSLLPLACLFYWSELVHHETTSLRSDHTSFSPALSPPQPPATFTKNKLHALTPPLVPSTHFQSTLPPLTLPSMPTTHTPSAHPPFHASPEGFGV